MGNIWTTYYKVDVAICGRLLEDIWKILGAIRTIHAICGELIDEVWAISGRHMCDPLTMYKRNGRHDADDEWTMYGRNIRNIWTTYDQYMGDAWTTSSPPTYRLARSRLRCGAGIPTHPPPGSPRDRVSD